MLNKTAIENAIREALKGENLVGFSEAIEESKHLRINMDEDGQSAHVTFGDAPGNAYGCDDFELFIKAGIEFTGHQEALEEAGFYYDAESDEYKPSEDCEYSSQDDAKEDFEANISAAHIDEKMSDWLNQCENRYLADM